MNIEDKDDETMAETWEQMEAEHDRDPRPIIDRGTANKMFRWLHYAGFLHRHLTPFQRQHIINKFRAFLVSDVYEDRAERPMF